MKQLKRITSLIMVALLICMLSVTAFAHEIPDVSRKGSITVVIEDGDKRVPGGSLTLYKVGDVAEDDGNYFFELTEAFRASGVSLDDIESDQVAKDLAKYAVNVGAYGDTEDIDNEGRLVYRDLDVGLYLVVQKEAANGYLPINPFLVSVPMVDSEGYLYDVYAEPKVDDPEETTEDEDISVEIPSNPTFEDPEETTDISSDGTTSESETSKNPGPAGPGSTDDEDPDKPQLPLTGQLNWPVPVLVVLGLALISIGCTLRFSKRKANSHE